MDKYTYLQEVLGIRDTEIESYGKDKFKVSLSVKDRLQSKKDGKLILVTAITPTTAGEGKTTVSIGLAQGLKKIGKNVMLALREPSLGPVFGMKGGAIGGGVSSLEPGMDINLHFTGDLHAITAAHNLLAALIDNHIYFGNELKIKEVYWPRALDVNDRSLRKIQTATREDGFIITAASEIMAILALSKDFKDLKQRLNDILIGTNNEEQNVFVKDLGGADALALLLKDAIKPNIVFAKEMVPAFVHAGPFANIAHGCNSVIATQTALKLADYVVTEAGFAADLGMEKFLHIKQPLLSTHVSVVVVVATLKALKLHGGASDENIQKTDVKALSRGLENLEKHLENIHYLGLNPVVALNRFANDPTEELMSFDSWAKENKIKYAVSEGFAKGGEGTKALAKIIADEAEKKSNFKPLYKYTDNHIQKIDMIAKTIYGASEVSLSPRAKRKLTQFSDLAFPICMAKTPLSLSGNPSLKGRPRDFILEISDVRVSYGARLIVCLTKGINIMPGLNEHPRALDFRMSDEGKLIE